MAIKRLRIAFDIDVNVLAAALAQNNCGMHVQLAGNAIEGPIPDELEAPDGNAKLLMPHKKPRALLIAYLKQHHDSTVTINEITVALSQFGIGRHSVSNVVYNANRVGLIRRVGSGKYRITKEGIAYG